MLRSVVSSPAPISSSLGAGTRSGSEKISIQTKKSSNLVGTRADQVNFEQETDTSHSKQANKQAATTNQLQQRTNSSE